MKYPILNALAYKIADLLPARVMYYAIIRAFAWVSTHECSHKTPDEIGFSDVIKSWKAKFKTKK